MTKKKREPVIVQSLAIAVPPERVWRALTSPRDLGQLAFGKVVMAATPGASFSWEWGVWKAMAPRKGSFRWEGRVLAAVPGSTLVLGPSERALRASPESVVTFIVQGEAGSTLLTVIQGGPEKGIEDYEHGWADFLLKLKTLLETESTPGEVLVRALMRATPQQVYRAWLSAAALKKIIPGKATVTPRARFGRARIGRVGQRFAWQHKLSQHVHQGTFLELEKNRTISFTWESTQPTSEVRIGMSAIPYGTLVSAHHAGLPRLSRGQLFAQRSFWSRLLERLRCYLYFKGQVRS